MRSAMGSACKAHKHRELVPIEVHHILPMAHGGKNAPDNRIALCANAHGSVHYYLDLILKEGPNLAWTAKRKFGRKVRAIAEEGYRRINDNSA